MDDLAAALQAKIGNLKPVSTEKRKSIADKPPSVQQKGVMAVA